MMVNFNFEALDEPIEIQGLTSFVVENTAKFSMLVQSFHRYNEENQALKIFDKKYKSLKENEVVVITDVLGYDVNGTSVLKLIHDDLERQISECPETKIKIERLLEEVSHLVHKEMLDFEIELESEQVELINFLKAMRIKVEVQTSTIFERVLEIMQVFKYLTKKKLLTFINLGSYLIKEELLVLEEYARLQNIPVLLVDRHPIEGVQKQVILDEDFVILT